MSPHDASRPELFFTLRQADHAELIAAATSGTVRRAGRAPGKRIASERLGEVFGIDLADAAPSAGARASPRRTAPPAETTRGSRDRRRGK
jgi:hypothetical protein